MEKQTFNIHIDASPEKVWDILLGKETYPQWTSVFAEGSTVETDWQEGSRTVFHDGTGDGMVAVIARNIPNQFLSIKHIGMIKNGVEDLESEEVKKWAGAFENYTLKPSNGGTDLLIEMDIEDSYKDYFMEAWPKALEKVKELAEKQPHAVV